jgi:hypothetical protein
MNEIKDLELELDELATWDEEYFRRTGSLMRELEGIVMRISGRGNSTVMLD